MVHRYGLPSVYLTIFPDDIHAPLVLGMAIPPNCRDNEIGGISDAFANSMIPEIIQNCRKNYLNHFIDNTFLHKLGALNSVICAKIIKILNDYVICHLFGIVPSNNIKKNIRLLRRKKGIFGTAIASYAVLEVGGRKALYSHLLLWTKLHLMLYRHVLVILI